MKQETKDQLNQLSESIGKELTLDSNGAGTLPKDIFEKTLPEDMTLDTVKRVHAHRDLFSAAVAQALVDKAHPAMKENKDLAEASVETKVANDRLSHRILRRSENRSPADGSTVVTKGALRSRYVAQAGRGVGVLKQVSEDAKARFTDLAD